MKTGFLILENALCPGVGTLLAKQAARGTLQLLFALLAILLWSTGSLRLFAVLIFLFAWLWAQFSSLRFKKKSDEVALHPVSIVEERSRKGL